MCEDIGQKGYYLYDTVKHEVTNLLPYHKYTYTVTAENEYGLGETATFEVETQEDSMFNL